LLPEFRTNCDFVVKLNKFNNKITIMLSSERLVKLYVRFIKKSWSLSKANLTSA
jgi:hypothetical protein